MGATATASVSGDLVKFSQPVLSRLRNWVNDPTQTAGIWPNGTIGTLVRTENKAFGLVIVSYYGNKTVFSGAGMAPAFVFPFVRPLPTSENLGMRTKRVRIAFDCLPLLNGLGGGTLFTTDVSSLALPDPT